MKILALDPATKCGFALGDSSQKKPTATGTWDLSTRRDESSGMKLIRLRTKLQEMAKLGVDLLVYETPALHTPYPLALASHAKLVGAIEVFAYDSGIEYRGYAPNELKKFATGKGNANKEAVVAAVSKRWCAVTDENEADAIALLYLAMVDVAGVAVNPLVVETPLLDTPKKNEAPF